MWSVPLRLRAVSSGLLQRAIQGLWQPAEPPPPLPRKRKPLKLIVPLLVLRDPPHWDAWCRELNLFAPYWQVRREDQRRPWVLPQTHAVVYGRLVVLLYHRVFTDKEHTKGVYRTWVEHWCHTRDDVWPLLDRVNPYHTRRLYRRWLAWWDTQTPWTTQLVCVCQTDNAWNIDRCSICHNRRKVSWTLPVTIGDVVLSRGDDGFRGHTRKKRVVSPLLRLQPLLRDRWQQRRNNRCRPGAAEDWYYHADVQDQLRRLLHAWQDAPLTVGSCAFYPHRNVWRGVVRHLTTQATVPCPRNHAHGELVVLVKRTRLLLTCGVCVFGRVDLPECRGPRPLYDDKEEQFPRESRLSQNIKGMVLTRCRRHPWAPVPLQSRHPRCCAWTRSDEAFAALPGQAGSRTWITWGCHHVGRQLVMAPSSRPSDVRQLCYETFEPRGEFRPRSRTGFRFVVEWIGAEEIVAQLVSQATKRGLPRIQDVYRSEAHNLCRWVLPVTLSYHECCRLTAVMVRACPDVSFVDVYGMSQRPRPETWSVYHPSSLRPQPLVSNLLRRDTMRRHVNPRVSTSRTRVYWDEPLVRLQPHTTLHPVKWTANNQEVKEVERSMALFVRPAPARTKVRWFVRDMELYVTRRSRLPPPALHLDSMPARAPPVDPQGPGGPVGPGAETD
jgi:hypothetical protein